MLSLRRLLLLTLAVWSATDASQACTTFCLTDDRSVVFGRNFDYYCADGRVMVNRRGLRKTAFWTNSGYTWVSRFGSVTTNQFGHEFPNGGINEAGLVLEHMWLDGTAFPSDSRPSLSELQWIQYQLDCSASVEEVLASDRRVRIDAGSSPLHMLVADRTGRAAVIEFLGGRTVVHVDSTLPVAALTNDTYDASLSYAAAVLPEQASRTSSLGRFVHAAAAVRRFPDATGADPIAYAFDTLATVTQPYWTRWSIVYDLGNLSVYFRTSLASAIKQIRLDAVDFSAAAWARQMDINTPTGGAVVPTDRYTTADNLAVLTAVYRATAPLAQVSASYIRLRAGYPESVAPAGMPRATQQPRSAVVAAGEAVDLSVGAPTGTTVQWYRNGRVLPGATRATLRIDSVQPATAGIYTAVLSNAAGGVASDPAVVGLRTSVKVLGSASEHAANVRHAGSGLTYDQFLLTGPAATLTADPGQVSRISFIDLSDDIVQVEFSGPGALTLLLDGATGPAHPLKYDQNVAYMKGHATVVLAGATAETHVSIFSVGTVTNPAVVRAGETYDGHADVAALAVLSADGRLGGVRCGNAAFTGAAGVVGLYAPGVAVGPGPVNLHDVCAGDAAVAHLTLGSAGRVQITGGDLYQLNGGAIQVDGLAAQTVVLVPGTSSANVAEPARPLRARLSRSGADVSAEVVQRWW